MQHNTHLLVMNNGMVMLKCLVMDLLMIIEPQAQLPSMSNLFKDISKDISSVCIVIFMTQIDDLISTITKCINIEC